MHGNAVALEAVLADVRQAVPELVVFGGDLTWGPLPRETLALVAALDLPACFVRGNAERSLLEPAEESSERAAWMLEQHSATDLAFLATFVEQLSIEITGLGPTRFCHGSPRSDEELVTPGTPEARVREMTASIAETVLVTAHTHLQFDRRVAGIRSINAGSVGMPYEDRRGAFWALLGPDVELRRTEYPLDRAVDAYRATDDPLVEEMVEILLTPPTRDEVIEHAERLEFSGCMPAVATSLDIETPHGMARVHLHTAAEPARAALVLGHGAGGGVGSRDLVAATEAALGEGSRLRSSSSRTASPGGVHPRPPAIWTQHGQRYCADLRDGRSVRLAVVVGGRSSGARVACRTAAGGCRRRDLPGVPARPAGRRSGSPPPSRLEELDAVTVPTLVVQGVRDPFGMPPAGPLRTVAQVLGDHSLRTDLASISDAVSGWLRRVVSQTTAR